MASSSTPRFYLFPSQAESYIFTLAKCGERKLVARGFHGVHHGLAQSNGTRVLSAWVRGWANEISNPLVSDMRGGIGAEILACQAAIDHPQRTRSLDDASVLLVCAHW